MDKKYGAYICMGCGIGDALDIAALSKAAAANGMQAQDAFFLLPADFCGNGPAVYDSCAH